MLPRVAAAAALLFVFLVGVKGLSAGFRLVGEDLIQGFFAATENPFVTALLVDDVPGWRVDLDQRTESSAQCELPLQAETVPGRFDKRA